MEFKIRNASPADAEFISLAILTAIGDEIMNRMAGTPERIPLVRKVFSNLAASDHSQYSYLNTRIIETNDGSPVGAVVSYDGANLYALREAFINEANSILGWNLVQQDFSDETSSDEYYLDSLMVLPEYRRNGLGRLLIEDTVKRARDAGKPLGLLVDFDNSRAHRLYESIGFKNMGIRNFAGHDMQHMQYVENSDCLKNKIK